MLEVKDTQHQLEWLCSYFVPACVCKESGTRHLRTFAFAGEGIEMFGLSVLEYVVPCGVLWPVSLF